MKQQIRQHPISFDTEISALKKKVSIKTEKKIKDKCSVGTGKYCKVICKKELKHIYRTTTRNKITNIIKSVMYVICI